MPTSWLRLQFLQRIRNQEKLHCSSSEIIPLKVETDHLSYHRLTDQSYALRYVNVTG
jgi:hypothetical protein